MSEFVRAFLAFDLESEEVKKKLAHRQKLAVQTGADLKPVEPQNIHITLRFLGDITLSMAEKVFEQMQQIEFAPFSVQVKGLGVFPNLNYPRVLWAGITQGATQLQEIFNQIEPRLQKLGFTADKKGFNPHLTIARVRSPRNKTQLSQFVTQNTQTDFGAVTANCLRLKKSQLTPQGPIYTTLKQHCPNQQQ
ncbi:MAG: RNA 2',3'-cyclic phosphodiesterase [Candidatus Bathyarchaeota archaeon]|nr:RNA 2',3'-cyclic phosphodiesterase [Candidatus Bathyarchaeota archaeon]